MRERLKELAEHFRAVARFCCRCGICRFATKEREAIKLVAGFCPPCLALVHEEQAEIRAGKRLGSQ